MMAVGECHSMMGRRRRRSRGIGIDVVRDRLRIEVAGLGRGVINTCMILLIARCENKRKEGEERESVVCLDI
jgi:hypothetical protein